MKWNDITSYSRSNKDRTPQTWEQQSGRLRVCVTRKHMIPGTWFAVCHELNLEVDLRTDDLEFAKDLTVTLVMGEAKRLYMSALELKK